VDFSEARDLFVNIFQIPDLTKKHGPQVNFGKTEGLLCKIYKTGPRVDFRKTEGLLCKICKTGPRVDFRKTEGLLCKMAGKFGWDLFFNG
jgi:hypothetical protein